MDGRKRWIAGGLVVAAALAASPPLHAIGGSIQGTTAIVQTSIGTEVEIEAGETRIVVGMNDCTAGVFDKLKKYAVEGSIVKITLRGSAVVSVKRVA